MGGRRTRVLRLCLGESGMWRRGHARRAGRTDLGLNRHILVPSSSFLGFSGLEGLGKLRAHACRSSALTRRTLITAARTHSAFLFPPGRILFFSGFLILGINRTRSFLFMLSISRRTLYAERLPISTLHPPPPLSYCIIHPRFHHTASIRTLRPHIIPPYSIPSSAYVLSRLFAGSYFISPGFYIPPLFLLYSYAHV
ncbi:hypothetical protein C8R44DRAFT_818699 [Mycena epipterygia]|nr:hypothetical protein C8R44DRAFT_818699 [Mycena epipterygia]